MAATTTLLGLVTPTQGTLSGTWGNTVNYGISDYVDIAIAGTLSFADDGAITLANTTGSSSGNAITTTTAQYMVIRIIGTQTVTKVITGPSYSKLYMVDHAGATSAVTFKASGQTGVSVAVGEKCFVYYNGTDYVKVSSSVADGVTSVGGTGTVNGITLTGTVTSTGNLTLGGTLANVSLTSQVTGTLPVLNGGTGVTTSTGTVNVVLSNSPTLVTPAITTSLTTASTSFALLNTTATTINFGGAATTLTIGAATGTMTVANTTLAAKAITASTTLGVTGVSTLTGGAVIEGLTVGLGGSATATSTAVGVSALAAQSGGARNTAVGYQAADSVIGGTDVTAIGYLALSSATAGTDCTAVGSLALRDNTANGLTAVGYSALRTNTTGYQNTAVGYSALDANLTASNNTAVGNGALRANTGGQNTAVGDQALAFNNTGTENTAVGTSALSSNTTGSYNTALGVGSLVFNTTGSNSTAIGRYAGFNTTGSNNIYLGYNSGLDVTSGSNNVVIGGYSGSAAPISATGSNYIVLSDGAGTVRQVIDSSGNVGIGTTAPSAKLDVAGNAIISVTDNTNAALRITQLGTGNALLVEDSANPDASPVVIEANGRVVAGATQAYTTTFNGNTFTPIVQAHAVSSNTPSVGYLAANWATTSGNSSFTFAKSRGGATGTHAIALSGDDLGVVYFMGSDGTAFIPAASITSAVDGTPGLNDMPGRLIFSTTADGGIVPTERVRITSTGNTGFATAAPAATVHVAGNAILSNVNVIGASYDSVSFSVAAEEGTPTEVFFSPDGLKMYIVGATGDEVNEYNLSTAWVVSSAVFVINFSVAGQDTAAHGLFFRADGTKMYIVGQTNDTVFQYTLSTPWSVSTASYDSISFSVATQETSPTSVSFKPNGLSMYVVGTASDSVNQYTLSTAWDVSTATFLQSFSIAGQEGNGSGLAFTGDGSRMFVVGSTGDDVNVYDLTTPWNISTSASVGAFSVSGQSTSPQGIFIKPDGTKMYIVDSGVDTVFQYTVPSIDIQLTGQTSVAALDVQQDLIVYGNTQAYKISASSGVLVTSAAGLGYGTGSGGAVTQLTSRTTGVTLSKPTGAITMFSAAGSVVAATFTVTNTLVAATDTIILNQKSGTNLYVLLVTAVAAGSFNVTFYTTGGVATDAPVINFSLIKGVIT